MPHNLLEDVDCRAATSERNDVRKLPDSGGLYLWVYADGRKYWRLSYWLAGKEKSISLGVYPSVTVKEAWVKRNVCLQDAVPRLPARCVPVR